MFMLVKEIMCVAAARRRSGLLIVLAALAASAPTSGRNVLKADETPGSQTRSGLDVAGLPNGVAAVDAAIKSFEKGDYDACLAELAKAAKANPGLPPAHALFAKLAFMTHRNGLARSALELAAREDRKHPEVYLLFANLALLEGRQTDAAVHLEKAATLSAESRWTAEQRTRFERMIHQGEAMVAEARGDGEGMRAALAAWLRIDPTNAAVRRQLGIALFGLGRREEGRKEIEQASKADPKLDPPALTLGWLYTKEKDLKRAEEWMNYAVKAYPKSVPVRLAVASWFLEQGRGDDAKAQVDAAAKLDPKSTEARRLLGLIARSQNDHSQAEAIFQSLAQDAPGDDWLRNQLALSLAEQTDPAKRRKAVELAELSIRQDSKSPDAMMTLGEVYYLTDRKADAAKILQAVINTGRANSDAVYYFSRILQDEGRPEKAEPLLKTALSAPGLFLRRKEAKLLLDRLATKAAH